MDDVKLVYMFEEGSKGMKKLLGGKGSNLAEMTSIGLPVPPGFVITTEACNEYYRSGEKISETLRESVFQALKKLEERTGKALGSSEDPLLISVRSGAYYSMPGMMDTILNLGLNDTTVEALAEATNSRTFALDCYRRLLQMYADVVLGISNSTFERVLEEIKASHDLRQDEHPPADVLEKIIEKFKKIIDNESSESFPQDPYEQLLRAVSAVFASWNNPRAVVYRKLNNIPHDLGTAVNVQTMVFGNMGEGSGTGVAFTRNPSTGEKEVYGEFLFNAQGEDVVAGTSTPLPVSDLKNKMPELYEQFINVCEKLENHYRDMQDIEFTVERGNLYLLQTRNGKRTANAGVKIAVDLVDEGKCDRKEALMRVDPSQLDQLLHKQLDTDNELEPIAKGLPASPGAAVGKVVFDADTAEERGENGEKVVLVRSDTTPDDIHGIVAAQGVLTSRGGMTSHAAVVARGMGKPCVSGCDALRIMAQDRILQVGEQMFSEGDTITIDGTSGKVFSGEAPLIHPQLSSEFNLLLSWADEIRTLGVRANADTREDARKAREFGAKGIGLCRTEHMFMQQDRLPVVEAMILAETQEEREKELEKLLPMQQGDFEEILREMEGLPVTIRLLDPPLHEFLPNLEELVVEVAATRAKGEGGHELQEKNELLSKVRKLTEFNPMLGHRGCRLALSYPEIYRMQVRAICRAAAKLQKEGIQVEPEIMIPLVSHYRELEKVREIVEEEAQEVLKETNANFNYYIGTMMELPRACVTADQIAQYADFFSFGTNDLTQTSFGFSRDDAEGKFLPFYLQERILPQNPFMVLDEEGVGELLSQAVNKGKKQKPELKMGICGEHGGEQDSIAFCNQVGLDYVSCSPFRVPIARLAAAQACLKE